MPKIGMEPIRRDALVKAAIREVGEHGAREVTVGQIARRAGVSTALAHHYFGGKDQILSAAMRHILALYGAQVRREISGRTDARARLEAIVRAGFAPSNFRADVVAAWLSFYVSARTQPEARRLLDIYQRRLRSNLVHALNGLGAEAPKALAEDIAALIDGIYLRVALSGAAPDGEEATARVLSVFEGRLP